MLLFRCRANSAHVRQSRPDSGWAVKARFYKTVKARFYRTVPARLYKTVKARSYKTIKARLYKTVKARSSMGGSLPVRRDARRGARAAPRWRAPLCVAFGIQDLGFGVYGSWCGVWGSGVRRSVLRFRFRVQAWGSLFFRHRSVLGWGYIISGLGDRSLWLMVWGLGFGIHPGGNRGAKEWFP